MAYKPKSKLTKCLNPFLGFGWKTETRLKTEVLHIKSKKNTFKNELSSNQSY